MYYFKFLFLPQFEKLAIQTNPSATLMGNFNMSESARVPSGISDLNAAPSNNPIHSKSENVF